MTDIEAKAKRLHSEALIINCLAAARGVPDLVEPMAAGGVTAVNWTIAAPVSISRSTTLSASPNPSPASGIKSASGVTGQESSKPRPISTRAKRWGRRPDPRFPGHAGPRGPARARLPVPRDGGTDHPAHISAPEPGRRRLRRAERRRLKHLRPRPRQELNRLGILIDLSHVGPRTTEEALQPRAVPARSHTPTPMPVSPTSGTRRMPQFASSRIGEA